MPRPVASPIGEDLSISVRSIIRTNERRFRGELRAMMDPRMRADANIIRLLYLKSKKAMKKYILPVLIAAGAFVGSAAQADEIQFTTLPQPVQTTVVRETHITGPANVVRVVHESNGVYAVTVHREEGDKVVYVTESGAIAPEPAATTTTTTTEQTVQPAAEEQQTVVTYDQIKKDQPRYELIEKKGRKEIYLDHQTGKKVKVERDK